MSETPSATIAQLLRISTDKEKLPSLLPPTEERSETSEVLQTSKSALPKPPKPSDGLPKPSESLRALLQKESQKRSKQAEPLESCPSRGVQSIALGDSRVRQKFYTQYRKHRGSGFEVEGFYFGCGGRDIYRYCVRRWEDDAPTAPMMLGMVAYRTKAGTTEEAEKTNPFDEKSQWDDWLEWFAGFHHARRKSGERHDLDAS